MKKHVFTVIVTISLIAIVIMQGTWYTQLYKLNHETLERQMGDVFMEGVEREMKMRLRKAPLGYRVETPDTLHGLSPMTAYNEQLEALGLYVSVVNLDSIISEILKTRKLDMTCMVLYRSQADGKVLEYSGKGLFGQEKIICSNEFYTLLDCSKYLQLVALDPYALLNKRMEHITLFTALLMMIVMGALCGQLHLFRTEKKLRQKEEAFMQAVVHNMKNPVSVVKSCVETLTDEDIDRVPRLKAMASDKLKMNAASLSSLVSQSMVLFDIVQGTKLRKEKVNIEQTIAYWMDVFGEITNKTVTYKLDLQIKELLAEKDMFREMIGNLISNSIKYSGDSVEIEISSKCDRKQVVFRIRDNGWGIPQKDRERIFRKYERIHINKDTLPGFGLGLTYVADAMKLHGGKVSVESKRGEGSEFSLYFPNK